MFKITPCCNTPAPAPCATLWGIGRHPETGRTMQTNELLEPTSGQATPSQQTPAGEKPSSLHSLAATIPLCVLGVGVYRAWIEIMFVGSFVDFPFARVAGHDLFDVVMIAVLLALAFAARRVVYLAHRRWVPLITGALLVASTALGFWSLFDAAAAQTVAVPACVCGGAGIALMILLWSELYGQLSPVRICLYYALSLVLGASLVWVYRGFVAGWLPVMTGLLPLLSLAMLFRCYAIPSVSEAPQPGWVGFSFPWKPVLVIATYSFAFGVQESLTYQFGGPHSAAGMVVCALLVAGAIAVFPRAVPFGALYSRWLPMVAAVALVLPVLGSSFLMPAILAFSSNLGYAATEIFIMVMIGSIVYNYGANALWLFGIERAVRALAMLLGRAVYGLHLVPDAVLAAMVVIAVLVATYLILTEGRVSSDWGVTARLQRAERTAGEEDALRRARLVERCREVGQAHRLSQREEEVLLLLAERKTISQIEHELYIANGTAKAHIRHVYAKLGIHSREELFELVGE